MTLALIAIPVLPLLASLLAGVLGRWLRERSHLPTLFAVAASFALSVAAVFHVVESGPVQILLYSWIGSGVFDVQFGLLVDRLTVVMLVMVTAISGLVQSYSVRYMQGDVGYARFFAYVSLFTGSMLMLVMSDNLLMLFLFWEEVGLCSYLLIGFTYERQPACDAAVKAFWVNRIGDGGFLLAILLTFVTFGTLDTLTIMREAPSVVGQTVTLLGPYLPVATLTLLTLLFLFSALAKSAQLPLHVWLPDAMEAPTPVSALIHAATMVTAGVFLIARFSPMFDQARTTLYVLAAVGGCSAIFGACVSLVQTDIKRVLAYSTMSQLGFMIMACGLGVYGLAIFHLVAHAAFKSLLFLTAGMAIEEVADRVESPEPVRPVSRLPARFWLLWISGVALASLPPIVLLAGGKELFRLLAPVAQGHIVFWVLAWATALMTVVYLLRLVVAAAPRSGREGEPLRLLTPQAIGFVVATMGVVTFSSIWGPLVGWTWFERFLAPALPAPLHGAAATAVEGSLSTVALVVVPLTVVAVVGGVLYPVLRQRAKAAPGRWERWSRTLYVLVLNRGYVDEIYHATLVRPLLRAARWLSAAFEEGVIDRAVNGVGEVLSEAGRQLRQVQSGQFHHYAVAVVVGAILIVGLYLVGG